MSKINIIDKPCGSGKTSEIIEVLRQRGEGTLNKFLVVVPLLKEVKRYKDALPNFHVPEGEGRSKTEELELLLKHGQNVIITHALLQRVRYNADWLEDYIVIIDEMPDVIKGAEVSMFTATEALMLKDDGYLTTDNKGLIKPTEKAMSKLFKSGDRYESYKRAGLLGTVVNHTLNHDCYLESGTTFITHCPIELFTKPHSVIILTFLYEGSLLDAYFKFYGLEVNHNYSELERVEFKKKMNNLLRVIKPHHVYNCSYTNQTSLKNHDKTKDTIITYSSLMDTPSLIVSAKDFEKYVETPNQWLPSVTRGTNEHSHFDSMVYVYCQNLNPAFQRHLNLTSRKDNEYYRISELIQVIYRGCIRKGEPMTFATPDENTYLTLLKFMDKTSEVREWFEERDGRNEWQKMSKRERETITKKINRGNERIAEGKKPTKAQQEAIDSYSQYL